MPITLDFHYVDELIAQRQALHGGLQGAPPVVNGYRVGESINRSCVVMLSAQMQTFVKAVFREVSKTVLPAMSNVDAYMNNISRWGNPSDNNIKQLFLRLGVDDVLSGLSWQKCPTASVKKKLRNLNEIRNGIAHGKKSLRVENVDYSLSLAKVSNYRQFCYQFAYYFEQHAMKKAKNI